MKRQGLEESRLFMQEERKRLGVLFCFVSLSRDDLCIFREKYCTSHKCSERKRVHTSATGGLQLKGESQVCSVYRE